MDIHECSFCKAELELGTGKMFVKRDGTVFYFCKSKCERNMLKLKRVARKTEWTKPVKVKKKVVEEEPKKPAKKAEKQKPAKKAEKQKPAKGKKTTAGTKKTPAKSKKTAAKPKTGKKKGAKS
ncbi:MAG: 50S ribosomal protein L24e [Candidatus Hydrothermarchaeales archaeon]